METKTQQKTNLHPNNLHRSNYPFEELVSKSPELLPFVFTNEFKTKTIDFANPLAVKALNKALLLYYYNLDFWDIPENYLCPPIPGRADYIHYLADLLNIDSANKDKQIIGLDIGTGANMIYPILGNVIYQWQFVAVDIDPIALNNAANIIQKNPFLQDQILLQQQLEPQHIFRNIITPEDKFDFTICNPPFHASLDEANLGTYRKWKNLGNKKTNLKENLVLNFGGKNNELWCPGGEYGFVNQMILDSKKYAMQVKWFTTLISKQSNLKNLEKSLQNANASQIKIIEMAQGQKTSRILAWTFLSEKQLKNFGY